MNEVNPSRCGSEVDNRAAELSTDMLAVMYVRYWMRVIRIEEERRDEKEERIAIGQRGWMYDVGVAVNVRVIAQGDSGMLEEKKSSARYR